MSALATYWKRRYQAEADAHKLEAHKSFRLAQEVERLRIHAEALQSELARYERQGRPWERKAETERGRA